MKKLTAALLLMFTCPVFAQSYKLAWGDEMKMKKGTTDMDIVAADNTGVYFAEGHLKMKTYFVVGATYGTAYKLIKFDKNFNEVFEKDYKRELKGLDFHSYQTIGNDLYMMATSYDKKEKLFKVYSSKVDKNTGDLMGNFTEMGNYVLENKKDDYNVKFESINNGKNFLMVSDISNDDRNAVAVTLLDNRLTKKGSAVINLAYQKGHYSLEDVKFTTTGKIVLLGKELDEVDTGKKKKKKLVFKQYRLTVYNSKGEKESDISVDAGSRYVIGGKLVEEPNGGLLLAGFYSNDAKKENLDGFYLNKIDVVKGTLALSSFKEINAGMLGAAVADDADDDKEMKESKKAAKKASDDDNDDEFPNSFIIRTVEVNPSDNSYVLTAEISKYSSYTYTSSSYANGSWSNNITRVHRFANNDVLVIDADKEAQIKWVNVIPKSQLEEVRSSNSMNNGISFYTDFSGYFATGGGMPYYSSYTSLVKNNQLILILNDHVDNRDNADYGNKVKTIANFKNKSNTYGVSIDLATGKVSRKFISANSEDLILMPRHSYVVNNEIFVPSMRPRLLAKTELKMAKITIR